MRRPRSGYGPPRVAGVIDPSQRPLCVKVCGITRTEDAVAAIEAGADLLGFNFYPKSPRFITPEAAAPIVALLPRQVLGGWHLRRCRGRGRPGRDRYGQDRLLQFHGNETVEYCRGFDVPAMKALRIASFADLDRAAARYPGGWLLADTADPALYGALDVRSRSSR